MGRVIPNEPLVPAAPITHSNEFHPLFPDAAVEEKLALGYKTFGGPGIGWKEVVPLPPALPGEASLLIHLDAGQSLKMRLRTECASSVQIKMSDLRERAPAEVHLLSSVKPALVRKPDERSRDLIVLVTMDPKAKNNWSCNVTFEK